MAKFLKIILPPKQWQFIVAIAAGIFFGLTAYILYVSNAVSYMSDDPKTCINCHVMNTEYVSWTKSSHRENATCNDCHVPQNNFINKTALFFIGSLSILLTFRAFVFSKFYIKKIIIYSKSINILLLIKLMNFFHNIYKLYIFTLFS